MAPRTSHKMSPAPEAGWIDVICCNEDILVDAQYLPECLRAGHIVEEDYGDGQTNYGSPDLVELKTFVDSLP